MIIKSKTHKSAGAYGAVLEYVLRPEAQYRDVQGRNLLLRHNLTGSSVKTFTSQFLKNLEYRKIKKSNSISILHHIVSFHPDDTTSLTDVSTLKDIGRQYIRSYNPKGQYLIVAHQDKEHIHLHIIASPVEVITGKSLRKTKLEFSDFQKQMQDYQIKHYPKLSRSVVEFGKSKAKKKSILKTRST